MSSTVLPPLNSDLPMQNGQKANPVDFIKENKMGNKSKFNINKRAKSLARGSGRPILGDSSAQESQGVYKGNFSFKNDFQLDGSVGNHTADKGGTLNLKSSEKRKVKRNFRPRAASLFDFDKLEGATNPELSVMQDTASSNMYTVGLNTKQPSTAEQAEQQQAQQQRLEARLVAGLRTQTIQSPKGKLGAMRAPRLRKVSPARRSPVKDQVQVEDKQDAGLKVKIKATARQKK